MNSAVTLLKKLHLDWGFFHECSCWRIHTGSKTTSLFGPALQPHGFFIEKTTCWRNITSCLCSIVRSLNFQAYILNLMCLGASWHIKSTQNGTTTFIVVTLLFLVPLTTFVTSYFRSSSESSSSNPSSSSAFRLLQSLPDPSADF